MARLLLFSCDELRIPFEVVGVPFCADGYALFDVLK